MYKVWSISLCYTDPDIIRDSLRQLQATRDKQNVDLQIVMLDQHWPLLIDRVRKEALMEIALENNAILLDAGKNIGLHKGFNYAFNSQAIPDNAMVIGYDPDSYPVTPGWDRAMGDVFVADESIVWLSLWHQHSTRELNEEGKGLPIQTIAGHRVQEISRAAMNSVCGFRAGWLRKIKGLKEPKEFYGGLECNMWTDVRNYGRWVFMCDYKEEPVLYHRMNPLFREWKWKYAHEGLNLDFPTFLASKSK